MTTKESIIHNDDFSELKVSANCTEKYARKILQQYLKDETGFRGGWVLTLDRKTKTQYCFKCYNLYRNITNEMKELFA